ncbi:hypothetical protein vseg_012159 [Gypsophila vaccaria]
MIFVVGELYTLLVTKNGQDKITKAEVDFFLNWRAKALRSAVAGGTVATSFAFIASRKLNTFNRLILSGGSGVFTGLWRLQEAYVKCGDQILGLDGTRMQHELKKIVLQRYGNNPHKMKSFSKYFYGEEVYTDSNPEHPRLVFRQRHLFMDYPKVTNDDAYGVSDVDDRQQNHQQSSIDRNSPKQEGPNMEIKQVRINPGISLYGYGDPLEVLFGSAFKKDETEQPKDTAKVQGRNQKKLRRRQRMRERQRLRESLSLGQPQLFTN